MAKRRGNEILYCVDGKFYQIDGPNVYEVTSWKTGLLQNDLNDPVEYGESSFTFTVDGRKKVDSSVIPNNPTGRGEFMEKGNTVHLCRFLDYLNKNYPYSDENPDAAMNNAANTLIYDKYINNFLDTLDIEKANKDLHELTKGTDKEQDHIEWTRDRYYNSITSYGGETLARDVENLFFREKQILGRELLNSDVIKHRDAENLEQKIRYNTDVYSMTYSDLLKLNAQCLDSSMRVCAHGHDIEGQSVVTMTRMDKLTGDDTYRGSQIDVSFGSAMMNMFLSEEDKAKLAEGEKNNPDNPYESLLREVAPEGMEDILVDDFKKLSTGIGNSLYRFQSSFYKSLDKENPAEDAQKLLGNLVTDLEKIGGEHGIMFGLLQSKDIRTRQIVGAALMRAWEDGTAEYRQKIDEEIKGLNPEQLRKMALIERQAGGDKVGLMGDNFKNLFMRDNFETAYGVMLLSAGTPMFLAICAAPFVLVAAMAALNWAQAKNLEKQASEQELKMDEHINALSHLAAGESLYFDIVKAGMQGRSHEIIDKVADPKGLQEYMSRAELLKEFISPIMKENFDKEFAAGSQEELAYRQQIVKAYSQFMVASGMGNEKNYKALERISSKGLADQAFNPDGTVREGFKDHEESLLRNYKFRIDTEPPMIRENGEDRLMTQEERLEWERNIKEAAFDPAYKATEDVRKNLDDYGTCIDEMRGFEENVGNVSNMMFGDDAQKLDDPEVCRQLSNLTKKYNSPIVGKKGVVSHGAYTMPFIAAQTIAEVVKGAKDLESDDFKNVDWTQKLDSKYTDGVEFSTQFATVHPDGNVTYSEKSHTLSSEAVMSDVSLRFLTGQETTKEALQVMVKNEASPQEIINTAKGLTLIQQALEAKGNTSEDPESNVFIASGTAEVLSDPGVTPMLIQMATLQSLSGQLEKYTQERNPYVVKDITDKIKKECEAEEDQKIVMAEMRDRAADTKHIPEKNINLANSLLLTQYEQVRASVAKMREENPDAYDTVTELLGTVDDEKNFTPLTLDKLCTFEIGEYNFNANILDENGNINSPELFETSGAARDAAWNFLSNYAKDKDEKSKNVDIDTAAESLLPPGTEIASSALVESAWIAADADRVRYLEEIEQQSYNNYDERNSYDEEEYDDDRDWE